MTNKNKALLGAAVAGIGGSLWISADSSSIFFSMTLEMCIVWKVYGKKPSP